MTQSLDIVIKNDFSEMAQLSLGVNEFLEKNNLDARATYAVDLALEEVLTNIIKYGYDDDNPHEIQVGLAVDGAVARLTIIDDGRKFDVDKAPVPDMSTPVAERDVGGLGIHLVRNMLDSLKYSRNSGKNILELTIKGVVT